MKRLKVFFAAIFLLLALPFWRYLDTLIWISPSEILYALSFLLWGLIFIIVPVRLLKRTFVLRALLILLALSFSTWYLGPLSKKATSYPDLNHCGHMSYTGMLYGVRNFITRAHADDLEVRNQLCWVRKMILRLPERFDNEAEYITYMKITQDKLMRPENKYRVSLPMIALLQGMLLFKFEGPAGMMNESHEERNFFEGLKFWIDHYTVEISSQEYSFLDWPHGPYIQFEYGLIERNWEKIVQGLSFEE